MHMDQSHSTVKPWSLVVILLAGKFIFMTGIIFHDKNIFSDAETEIWDFIDESNQVVGPTLPDGDYAWGIGLYLVPFNFCSN